MTIGEWLRHAKDALAESGCPDPQIDSRWIAEDTLGHGLIDAVVSRSDLRATLAQLLALHYATRVQGEPVQYLLNSACFMGLNFYVDSRVLIPRQDTETLVEAVIVALRQLEKPRMLDLCAGSGAIGLSVKTLVPGADVTLADCSRDALEVVRENARRLGVDVEIRHGDLFHAVWHQKFDLIASNPPYIPTGDLPLLQREVQREPQLALDGGGDGLEFYRRIAADAPEHLNPGGSIYLEVGAGQADAVRALLAERMECAEAGVINDLNGIPRVVWARSV